MRKVPPNRAGPSSSTGRKGSEELLALAVVVLAGLLVPAAFLHPEVAAVAGLGADRDRRLAVVVVLGAAGRHTDDLVPRPVPLVALGEQEAHAGGPAVLLPVAEVALDVGRAVLAGVGAPRADIPVRVVRLPLLGGRFGGGADHGHAGHQGSGGQGYCSESPHGSLHPSDSGGDRRTT